MGNLQHDSSSKKPSAKVSNRVYDILICKFMENTIPITKQIKSPSKMKLSIY